MKTPHLLPSLVVIVTFLLAIAASAQESAPRALFDGKTLAGWHSHGATGTKNWRVKGGAIICDAEKLALVSDAEFGDFELTLEWRVEPRGNGGIFYLIGPVESGDRVNAPECNVMDDSLSPSNQSGALYNHPQPIKSAAKKVGEWNTAKIVHHSGKVEHWINGERAVSADVRGKIPGLPASGKIALQSWSGTVAYRKIMIRALGPAETLTVVPPAPPEPTTPAVPAPVLSGRIVTPAEWLKEQAAPTFRSGHTLPPLTRWGWGLALPGLVDLADRWGYSLEISLDRGGGGPETAIRNLDDPSHLSSQLVAMVAANPQKYQLAVVCSQSMPPRAAAPPETWTRDKDGKFITIDGGLVDRADAPGVKPLLSPEAPDSYWQETGRLCAEALRKVRVKCPIAVILNGGEYGLAVEHGNRQHWEKDPRIVTAKGKRTWHEYLSASYGRQHRHVTAAVHQAVPDCRYYVHYTGGYSPYRMRDDSAQLWQFDYRIAKGISDFPNCAIYYKGHFDTDWIWKAPFGDCLTVHLNGKTYQIECGTPLSYEWFNGGWCRQADQTDTHMVSDLPRYMGYLKCSYVAGALGGVAGYFSLPPRGGFDAAFDMSQPPPALQQIVALSEVHALFSHYEDFIRNGDLLPGPDQHRWSKDLPAYEFPTDGIARVLARKHKQRDEWLLTAWAADGKDRDVSVSIAKLGKVKLHARATGSVYLASKGFSGAQLKLLDEDGLRPTPRLGTGASSAAPVTLTITPPAEVNATSDPRLAALHTAWAARFDAEANKPFETAIATLNTSYIAALGRARTTAKNNGALAEVLSIDAEIQQIKTSNAPAADAAETPPALTTLRKTWRDTSAKHATARDAKLTQLKAQYAKALDALIIELTKANKIDEAKRAQQFRDGLGK